MYYCLSKENHIDLRYIIDNQGQFDPTYPGFANFHNVPFVDWFVHCMADYKRQDLVVWHLANRLRQDYPTWYYRILRGCQEARLPLHNSVYDTPELSPSLHKDTYFEGLSKAATKPGRAETTTCFYGKSMVAYRSVETLFSLPFEAILKQEIGFDTNATIAEETEPTLKQTLHYQNSLSQQAGTIELDSLGMVLYDAVQEPRPIGAIIDEVALYFPPNEINANYYTFQQLVLDRIKEGLYLGTLRLSLPKPYPSTRS